MARDAADARLEKVIGAEVEAAIARRTHDPRPSYKPMQWVYPRVDLHPDGVLRSIYSDKTFTAEELIRPTPGSSASEPSACSSSP